MAGHRLSEWTPPGDAGQLRTHVAHAELCLARTLVQARTGVCTLASSLSGLMQWTLWSEKVPGLPLTPCPAAPVGRNLTGVRSHLVNGGAAASSCCQVTANLLSLSDANAGFMAVGLPGRSLPSPTSQHLTGDPERPHLLGGGPSHWAWETVWGLWRDSVTGHVCCLSRLYPRPQESAASGLSLPGMEPELHGLQAV